MRKPFNGRWALTRGFGGALIRNDAKYGTHKGMDWALPVGTPLLAACSGVVTYASEAMDAGNTVTIRTPDGLAVKCFHMATIAVRAGQKVLEGEIIGTSGATGNVTGPHLHFQVERGGVAIDPAPLLKKGEMDKDKVITPKVNRGDIDNLCSFLLGRKPTNEDYARVGADWKTTAMAYIMGQEFTDRQKRLLARSAAADELERARDQQDYPLIESLRKQIAESDNSKLAAIQDDLKVIKTKLGIEQ